MRDISDIFSSIKQTIFKKENDPKIISVIIKDTTGIVIDSKSITQKGNNLIFKNISGIVRNEIILQQKKILNEIKIATGLNFKRIL